MTESSHGHIASREWLHYHPAEYQGPVWFRVLPQASQLDQPHHLTAQWGQWSFMHSWYPERHQSTVFAHAKARDDHPVRIQVLVEPACHVEFGTGAPPDGLTIETVGSWRSRAPSASAASLPGRNVFVVHGRDERRELQVARLLTNAGLRVTVLHEVPNRGRTVIEKLEQEAINAAFAVVLLTGDDEARLNASAEPLRRRARQNVVLELGYFLALLGRKRVCALHESDVVLPSDYDGVLYLSFDSDSWKGSLLREIADVGLKVDWHGGLA